MKLFLYEWMKLMQRRGLWLLIAVLFFTNGILLVWEITNHESGYSLREVRIVYDDLKRVSESEQEDWLIERADYLTEEMLSQRYDMSEYPYWAYTETCVQETLLISHVQEQVQEELEYVSYLDDIQDQADQMTELTVFAKPDSFSYRNMLKTKAVYGKLGGVRTEIDISDGVRLLTDYRWTDIWLLSAMVILLLGIFMSEREEGLLSLLKPTKYGYAAMIQTKIAVMISAVVIFTLGFYGMNVLLAWKMVGFGDISRSIQSLTGYYASAMNLSVGAYMICFFAVKTAVVLSVCGILVFLSVKTRSSFYTLLFFFGISAIEILFWKQIDSHSWFWPLSQFNLASALDVGNYFASYENLNFFGCPVNHMFAAGIMSVGSIVVCVILTMRCFCTERAAGAGKSPCVCVKARQKRFVFWIHTNLWTHEAYKLLVTGKGLLLLIILGALQFGSYYDCTYYATAEEYEYHNYSASLEGKLYWRKELFLKKEKEQFEEIKQQIEDLYMEYEAGEISLTALELYEDRLQISEAKKTAFAQAETQYVTLSEYEGNGEKVAYIEQTGWDKLLGTEGRHEMMANAGKLLLVLSMTIVTYMVIEDRSGVDVLQRVSAVGRRTLTLRKLAACGSYAVVVSMLAFVPQVISVWNHYEMTLPAVSVHSILRLSEIPAAFSLRLWFFLFVFGKMASAVGYSWLLMLGIMLRKKK